MSKSKPARGQATSTFLFLLQRHFSWKFRWFLQDCFIYCFYIFMMPTRTRSRSAEKGKDGITQTGRLSRIPRDPQSICAACVERYKAF